MGGVFVDELYRYNRPALAPPSQEAVICNTLERARNAILELETLVEYTLIKETDSGPQINRTGWVGSLEKIREARAILRAARADLTTVWAALSSRYMKCMTLHY